MNTFTIEELTSMKRQALRHGDLELARMYQEDINALEEQDRKTLARLAVVEQDIKTCEQRVQEVKSHDNWREDLTL